MTATTTTNRQIVTRHRALQELIDSYGQMPYDVLYLDNQYHVTIDQDHNSHSAHWSKGGAIMECIAVNTQLLKTLRPFTCPCCSQCGTSLNVVDTMAGTLCASCR